MMHLTLLKGHDPFSQLKYHCSNTTVARPQKRVYEKNSATFREDTLVQSLLWVHCPRLTDLASNGKVC